MKSGGIETYLGVGLSGLSLGILIVWNPVFALAFVALAACASLVSRRESLTAFPWVLAILLGGYAFLGRGFAYLGVQPVFVGEVVLAIAVLSIVRRGAANALRLPLALPLALFAAWGAICTAPYVGSYGAVALRDAVVWGYSLFAVAVAVVLGSEATSPRLLNLYARATPFFLLWVPVACFWVRFHPNQIPSLAETGVPLIGFLPGDAAVHLAGIFAFLVLRLDAPGPSDARPGLVRLARRPLLWALWIVCFMLVSALNRGGMLAMLAAMALVVALRGGVLWFLRVAFVVAAISSLVAALGVELELGGPRRLSAAQLAANLGSVISSEAEHALRNTREWRLSWWTDIVDYTVHGAYFWTGKGFGVNLADSDGYQVGAAPFALRSPHNGHMTILARMGVPGVGFWVLLQAGFGLSMLAAWRSARARAEIRRARVIAWLLSYWAAALVNAAFSTALESPQAGIWFWSLFGYGLAMIAQQRASLRLHGAWVARRPLGERPVRIPSPQLHALSPR